MPISDQLSAGVVFSLENITQCDVAWLHQFGWDQCGVAPDTCSVCGLNTQATAFLAYDQVFCSSWCRHDSCRRQLSAHLVRERQQLSTDQQQMVQDGELYYLLLSRSRAAAARARAFATAASALTERDPEPEAETLPPSTAGSNQVDGIKDGKRIDGARLAQRSHCTARSV